MIASEDVAAIHDLINRYHYCVDEPGFPRLREIFTEDAVFDALGFGGGVSRGMEALFSRFAGNSGVLAHSCANIIVSEDPGGTVRCLSKCLALIPDGKMGVAIHKDVLRKTPAGWRIAERVLEAPPRLKA